MGQARLLIGIDVGGTFTDAVALDADRGELVAAFKIPSTPADPGSAVVAALTSIAQRRPIQGAQICHGTTVGTNTLIERRGARVGLVATQGFTDVLALRRQARPLLYSRDVRISEPLAPPELRFGVEERMSAEGAVVTPLADPAALVERLRAAGVESVAVCLLHSYRNDTHERAVEDAVRAALPGVFVTRSTDICPEFREYERTSTAVVNAYIGPAVSRYITGLDASLRERGVERLMIVKSNGGLTSPANAARYPVHLIESGPAAALIATAAYGRSSGRLDLIAFDMGGTTAKAGVIRGGDPEMSAEFYADRLVEGHDVGGYAIRSAVLDLVEIGAGGGSLAMIDEAGVLKVGPRSAGADPGPACYGRGGTIPTVTDAHAVIGTLNAETFAGTGIAFDREKAVRAVTDHVAAPFGWSLARAAYAIIDLAVANMAEMVRLATVQRGLDPRRFSMVASGGAGPLHAAALGREINAAEIIVPPYPGMFSALGATMGDVRHEIAMTLLRPLLEITPKDLSAGFEQLRARVVDLMEQEPANGTALPPRRILEARFVGQLFELRVDLGTDGEDIPPITEIEGRFRSAYRKEYGFDLPSTPIQAVNLRMVAQLTFDRGAEALFRHKSIGRAAASTRAVDLLDRSGRTIKVPLHQVAEASGDVVRGPALIAHAGSTVWVHEGQAATIGGGGEVIIAAVTGS